MIGRTNAGNTGGSFSMHNAIIHVQAPVGSTITFLKDDIIIKVLDTTKGLTNIADNTIQDWYYSINPNNFGIWTIQASLEGEVTTSKTVNIISNKEYYIWLIYNKYLIKNGHDMVGLSFAKAVDNNNIIFTENDGYAYFAKRYDAGNTFYKLMDVTNYNTLICEVEDKRLNGDNGGIGIFVSAPAFDATAQTRLYKDATVPITLTQDITSWKFQRYVIFRLHGYNGDGFWWVKINNFYLAHL